MTLAELIADPGVSREQLTEHLDQLSPAVRVVECVGLSPPQQRRLWELASARPHPGADLVTPGGRFAGRNTLPVLSRFQKWFSRQDAAVVGLNRHALGWLTGPGYFTVDPGPPLRFDYRRLPGHAPESWPAVVANTGLFSRPVYGDLMDEVAWVSGDVLVGSALRAGAPLNSYFVLARLAG